MSSIIVLSAKAESESSRARMEVEMLQGKQGGEGSAQWRHSQRGPGQAALTQSCPFNVQFLEIWAQVLFLRVGEGRA